MITRKNLVVLCVGVFTLMLLTAGASAFMTRNIITEDRTGVQRLTDTDPKAEKITWNEQRRQPQPQQAAQPVEPACDDANIVGAAIGAVAGGVVGNQIGSGKGQDLATIGGAIGGGYLGQQHIPTRNALCP